MRSRVPGGSASGHSVLRPASGCGLRVGSFAEVLCTDGVARPTRLTPVRCRSPEIHLSANRPLVVEMRDPVVDVLVGQERSVPKLDWVRRIAGELEYGALRQPLFVERTVQATSVVIVWRGELWPKFTVAWQDVRHDVVSESLGNKLMLR